MSAECTICQSVINEDDRGTIQSCNHRFCFVCIKKWAAECNTCPNCKKEFYAIKHKSGTMSVKKVKQKSVHSEDDDDFDFDYRSDHNGELSGEDDDDDEESPDEGFLVGKDDVIPEEEWTDEECVVPEKRKRHRPRRFANQKFVEPPKKKRK